MFQVEAVAPQFVVTIQDTKAPEGESVKFITKVKGEPAPEVMWFHDNQPIKDDDIYRIIAGEEGEVTLELPEVFPEDAGVYTVKAVNKHGEVSGDAVLTVLTGRTCISFEQISSICNIWENIL